ncbi:uncharacterized protein LOC126734630 [Anthonomus grandis grandis]|uniref:uncharacterized protein LOC126734630 n=1 Tax=Anthonomus grandis grandis TaxID=2921223 RepID=UPI002165A146|nr:uncharacterized protein LOC126734630 [Anthonomus grandis grandis]
MFFNDETSDEGGDTVNLFAKYLSKVYSDKAFQIPEYYTTGLVDQFDVKFVELSLVEVFDEILGLQSKTSAGPDGIPSLLLRECVCTLSKPICTLFNLSLKSGVFLSFWKNSYVTPIFKSSNTSDVSNYRGVCLQSTLPKLLDALVTKQLSWQCKSLIINSQHGFQKGRSTVTNLICYEDYLFNAFGKGSQVDAVYTDFSKAFDRVNHALLLAKLQALGLDQVLFVD